MNTVMIKLDHQGLGEPREPVVLCFSCFDALHKSKVIFWFLLHCSLLLRTIVP
jgi:hypothetical protein